MCAHPLSSNVPISESYESVPEDATIAFEVSQPPSADVTKVPLAIMKTLRGSTTSSEGEGRLTARMVFLLT